MSHKKALSAPRDPPMGIQFTYCGEAPWVSTATDRRSKQTPLLSINYTASIRGQDIVYFDRKLQNGATTKGFAINHYHFQTPKQNHEETV
jgi:hypothetical protein